jgi:hypothetical protein
MKKTNNKISKDDLSKKVALFKVALLVITSIIMLILTPSIFEATGNKLASNCPAYTEYGSCVLEHGLRAAAGAAAVSGIWILIAIVILIRSIYKYLKSNK